MERELEKACGERQGHLRGSMDTKHSRDFHIYIHTNYLNNGGDRAPACYLLSLNETSCTRYSYI